MQTLYGSLQEQQQHSTAIHKIAEQYHIQEEEIRRLYEAGLSELKSRAQIKNYLSVLVTRYVVDCIRQTTDNQQQ